MLKQSLEQAESNRESMVVEKRNMQVQLDKTAAQLEEVKKQNMQDKQKLMKQIEEEKKQAMTVQQRTDKILREKEEADQKYEDQKRQLERL